MRHQGHCTRGRASKDTGRNVVIPQVRREASGEAGTVSTLTVEFQSLELWEMNFCGCLLWQSYQTYTTSFPILQLSLIVLRALSSFPTLLHVIQSRSGWQGALSPRFTHAPSPPDNFLAYTVWVFLIFCSRIWSLRFTCSNGGGWLEEDKRNMVFEVLHFKYSSPLVCGEYIRRPPVGAWNCGTLSSLYSMLFPIHTYLWWSLIYSWGTVRG